jgi:hypothetical protein
LPPAQLAGGTVAIVGQGLAQHSDAAWAVAFVDHFLEILGPELASRLLDRSLDIFFGDTERSRFIDRVAQAHVARRVASSGARGDIDGAAKLGEKLGTLGVDHSFAVGNVC